MVQHETVIRVGIPERGGALMKAARENRLPCLISANAFAVHDRERGTATFRMPRSGVYEGMDIALDSAGFVAMAHYRGFLWSIDDYVALAGAAPWAWWAQADYCCEPEVAGDKAERWLRVAATARAYAVCRRLADESGIKHPMPVIQGFEIEDYLRCIDYMPILKWPELVGVGSVCRRDVGGVHGLERLVEALDKALPEGVRLHLFGVKSWALSIFGRHPRIASVDSCAWDFGARRKRPTGRTQAFRVEEMLSWRQRQETRKAAAGGAQFSLFGTSKAEADSEYDAVLEQWCDLVASGEIDFESARMQADRDLQWRTQRRGSWLSKKDGLNDGHTNDGMGGATDGEVAVMESEGELAAM